MDTVFHPTARAAATLLLLAGLAQTDQYDGAAPQLAGVVTSLTAPTLNDQDAELQHRGYYEKLDNPGRMSASLWAVMAEKPVDWMNSWDAGILQDRNDFLIWDLAPSTAGEWNGVPVTTNRWGMRDREYELDKRPGSFRIAVVGQSQVMGTYVRDEEVFDNVLEDRLNALSPETRFEILNFAVSDYALTQEYALIESRVLDFEPDVVIFTVAVNGRPRVVRHLLRAVYSGVDVPYPELQEILRTHGLEDVTGSGAPIPFASLRRIAEKVGLDARIPYSEALARTRLTADSINAWAIRQSAATIEAAGAVPVLMALSTTEGETRWLPELDVALENGIRVFNLLDVYSEADGELRVAPWDNHPNPRAHRLIADRLYDELEAARLLGPLSSGPDSPQTEEP